ncbi:MAG: FHA domain-containing protein [Planctomycetota bacterium]|nr:MAG: FHA domain-containing protein [Planctomycetota bacterium]
MPYLRLKITKNIEKIFEVQDGMTIGREPKNQIQLLNTSVSRVHAQILSEGDKFKVIDLGSSNGIKVNDVKVKEHTLEHGDHIQIGTMLIVFEADPTGPPQEYINIAQMELTPEKIESLCQGKIIAMIFPTSHEFVERAVEVGERYLDKTDFSESDKQGLVMAFREAIGNAARHGNKDDYNKMIKVIYENNGDRFLLSVEDEGEGFDFMEMLKKTEEGDAVSAARERYKAGGIGGLGLRVMLKCVDQLKYYNKGSRLVLVKRKNG